MAEMALLAFVVRAVAWNLNKQNGDDPAAVRDDARSEARRTGVDWRHVGTGMGGNSYWLTVDPNDDQTLFHSSDVGGVYRSRDGSRTRKHLAVEFSHERCLVTCTLITVAPVRFQARLCGRISKVR